MSRINVRVFFHSHLRLSIIFSSCHYYWFFSSFKHMYNVFILRQTCFYTFLLPTIHYQLNSYNVWQFVFNLYSWHIKHLKSKQWLLTKCCANRWEIALWTIWRIYIQNKTNRRLENLATTQKIKWPHSELYT